MNTIDIYIALVSLIAWVIFMAFTAHELVDKREITKMAIAYLVLSLSNLTILSII